jgi:hypothetical protein
MAITSLFLPIKHFIIKLTHKTKSIIYNAINNYGKPIKRTGIKARKKKRSIKNRFFSSLRRKLYKKTTMQGHKPMENVHDCLNGYAKQNLEKIEAREQTRRFFNKSRTFMDYVPLMKRNLDYTTVTITHLVKNTFVTVSRSQGIFNPSLRKFDHKVWVNLAAVYWVIKVLKNILYLHVEQFLDVLVTL